MSISAVTMISLMFISVVFIGLSCIFDTNHVFFYLFHRIIYFFLDRNWKIENENKFLKTLKTYYLS